MDSPFTRRNSVDESYNYNEQYINVSNTYLRLLNSITDNYSNNIQAYQTLMERCLTMGFQTQMNVYRLAHLNQRILNPAIFPQQVPPQVVPDTTDTQTSPIDTTPINIEPVSPTVPITPIRNTIRRNIRSMNPPIRRQNSISRRRYTEDTPIIPNPFYTHLIFPFDDVVVSPTNIEIEIATTVLRYDSNNWEYDQHTCPISLEQFEENSEIRRINVCGHIFKKANIDRWFDRNVRCPVCRYDIRNNEPDPEPPIPEPELEPEPPIPEPEPEPEPPIPEPEPPIPEPEPPVSASLNYDMDTELDLDEIADSILTDNDELPELYDSSNIILDEDTLDGSQYHNQNNNSVSSSLSSINLFNILHNELDTHSEFIYRNIDNNNNNPLSVLMNIGISQLDLSNNPL